MPRPSTEPLPGRRRCEASRRRFRRRRRSETKRSDLGWRFSFFSHSFFCKKKKEWAKEKTCPFRWVISAQEETDAALGPVSFLCLARKILERKNRLRSLKGFWAPSPRMPAHSVRSGAPWAVVGHRRPSQATDKTACCIYLSFLTGAHPGEESYRPEKDFSPV